MPPMTDAQKEQRVQGLIKQIAKTYFTKPADSRVIPQEMSQKARWNARLMKEKISKYLGNLETVRGLEMRDIVHVIYVLRLTVRYKANKKIIKKYGTLEYGRHQRIKSFRSKDGSLVCMDDKVIIRDKNTSTPGTSLEPEMEEEEEISDDEDDNSSEEGNEDENDLENDAIIEDEHMEEVQLEAPEDVKPEIFETTIDAIRILQSLYNMVFILREPMLKEFEDTVNKELENQRRRDTKILKRDFIQSMETGLRILVNGSTNQHDQQGLMKLEAILTPLTLQLLNLRFRHESPLVEQMMAENSEGKWIPIRKVNNVLILLFEAATPAIG